MMEKTGSNDVDEEGELICCEGCGCAKVTFIVCNSLFWAISLCILGTAAWQAAGNPTGFVDGSAVVTYCLLVVSCFSFIVCVLGFTGSIFENLDVMGSYLIIFVLVIFTQIGLILACSVLYPEANLLINQVWSEGHPYLREQAQSGLSCCGYETPADTYGGDNSTDIPASCYDDSGSIHTAGCGAKILDYFTKTPGLPWTVIILIITGIIEIVAFCTGGAFFHVLRMRLVSKDLDSDSKGDGNTGRNSRNKVVPLMISEYDADRQPKPQSHSSKPARSVASRKDIDVDLQSTAGNETPAPRGNLQSSADNETSETKGNEALFKVAGVMLDHER